jgi:hypothetical protein
MLRRLDSAVPKGTDIVILQPGRQRSPLWFLEGAARRQHSGNW